MPTYTLTRFASAIFLSVREETTDVRKHDLALSLSEWAGGSGSMERQHSSLMDPSPRTAPNLTRHP